MSFSAFRRERSRASGDIFSLSVLNDLAIFDQTLLFERGDVPVVNLVGQRHVYFIPPLVASLVAADQQDRCPPRVKSVKHPVRSSLMLNTQLAHVRVSRPADVAAVGKGERRPLLLEEGHVSGHVLLFGPAEAVPPRFEFVRVLDLLFHRRNIIAMEYLSRGYHVNCGRLQEFTIVDRGDVMKVILFGATGMVGQGILRECLRDDSVKAVLAIVRYSIGQAHPKLRDFVIKDMFDTGAGYDSPSPRPARRT